MKKSIHLLSIPVVACCLSCTSGKVLPPEPILPVPEPKQVEWQQMETYAFIHFGLNTFNDREWGYGDTDPKTFNPTNLDCEQWAQTLVKAGMKGVILTAKHHDGFCLWPFEGTDYSVKNSPWKNGQGNVVKELSEACKKYGLKFAVYLSPWDRHQANYGTPEYLPYFYAQLHDLLTNYGPVFEVWFDGANGGDGWYGGAKDIRTIDRKNYYNYPRIYEMLDSIQPQAIIFRWVGNEKGFAGATNWSFLRKGEVHPGYDKSYELQYGHPDGNQWVPAECDVSIRPGWFYHPEEDDRVKSPDQLVDLYYRSVGHNATLLLNFPVDRKGLIHPVATEDGVTTADIEFSFDTPTRMNRMMLQEYIPLGQRVKAFVVEYLDKDTWLPVKLNEETTTIGYKRLLRFETVETKGIRIRITDARGPLCLSNVGVYDAGNVSDSFVEKVEDIESVPYLLPDVKAEEAAKASDKQAQTTCFVEGDRLLIDLQEERLVSSLHFLPDQGEPNKGLRVGVSKDAVNQLVKSGEFSNIQNNPVMQSVFFTPVKARYIELKATRMIHAGEPMGFAELGVK